MVIPLAAGIAPASAQPAPAPAPAPAPTAQEGAVAPATIQKVIWLTDRRVALWINSPSMATPIQVQLLLARDWATRPDARFPVLYLLDGLRAQDDESGWTKDAGAVDFFADKNVTVVLPIGGQSSFYSDWIQPDNGKTYKWETFLTKELPPLLEAKFGMTGRNAIAGLSMSATSALNLATGAPGLYQAVGAYSGCPRTSDPVAQALVASQLGVFGANPANMWGTPDNPAWAANDPMVQAERLRGLTLYVSSGTGAPGEHDNIADQGIDGNPARLADRVLVGGAMETFVGSCTRPFVDRLHELGIPVTANLRPAGTHAWTYWQDDVHQSWPLFAAAIGA